MTHPAKHVGRHYITLKGCGDKEATLKTIRQITPILEKMLEQNLIKAYYLGSLYSEDYILDNGLEPTEVLLFSDGKMPIVFCNLRIDITTREESQVALDKFEEQFEMNLFKSFSY